jgi:hypothetical protein
MIEETLLGEGEHLFRFRFHLAPGLETSVHADRIVRACDKITNARLFIVPLDLDERPELEPRYSSIDYGAKSPSLSACWTVRDTAPLTVRWALVPVCGDEDEEARLKAVSDQPSAISRDKKAER